LTTVHGRAGRVQILGFLWPVRAPLRKIPAQKPAAAAESTVRHLAFA
jgi:hypothetical protein